MTLTASRSQCIAAFMDLPNQGLSRTSGDRQRVQPIKLKIIKIEKTFCSPEHYHHFVSAFTIFHFDQFSIDFKRYYFPSVSFVKCCCFKGTREYSGAVIGKYEVVEPKQEL